MLKRHEYREIRRLREAGLGVLEIARTVGRDEKTVRRWMDRPTYGKETPKTEPKSSILDPFKEEIRGILHGRPTCKAQTIFQRIAGNGYEGKYGLVKEYVRSVRPPKSKASGEYRWEKGESAQVDFGECGRVRVGNELKKVYVFVMVLSWSRMLYLRFTLRQSMEHFLDGHRRAFDFFGSAPRELRPDCCKTAVIGHDAEGKPIYNPRYEDMADHYGTGLDACDPHSPQQKGRVENGIKYVKGNFLDDVDPTSMTLDRLNREAEKWRDEVANVRKHRTTRQQPLILFGQERPHMIDLPLNPYDCAVVRTVSVDKQARFSFESNRYSAPPTFSSVRANLHLLPETLRLYYEGRLIASHPRAYDRRAEPIVHPDHLKRFEVAERKRRARETILRFVRLGPVAELYYEGLKNKQLDPVAHLRKILAVAERCDHDDLIRALRDAHEHGAYASDYVANLIDWRRKLAPENSPLHLPRHADLLELTFDQVCVDLYQKRIPTGKENDQ